MLLAFATQECVPVIMSDQIELPFQNVVDYAQISIKWPSTRIGPELLEYLESIPGHLLYSCLMLLGLLDCLVYHRLYLIILVEQIKM